jgi:hypothetical protein
MECDQNTVLDELISHNTRVLHEYYSNVFVPDPSQSAEKKQQILRWFSEVIPAYEQTPSYFKLRRNILMVLKNRVEETRR